MFDSSLLLAAGASFVAGLVGYIIVRLWIKPIVRYATTRRKATRELSRYREWMEAIVDARNPAGPAKGADRCLKNARKHAMDLTSCYTKEIPYWYRLLLDSRKESPAEVSGLLTNLTKIRDKQQVLHKITRAQQILGDQ